MPKNYQLSNKLCSQFDEIHDVIILEHIFEKCQECMSMYIKSCHLKKQIKKEKNSNLIRQLLSSAEWMVRQKGKSLWRARETN